MKELPFWIQLVAIAVTIPAGFWFRFRRVDGYALGFTAFLLLLAVAVRFLPALADKYSADQAQKTVMPGRFDLLGPIWLLCIPFAPLVVWLIGALTIVTDDNWQLILGSKTLVCVIVPLVCVLPLLKYIRGDAATIAILILTVGTMFPMSFGLTALQDLQSGPQHENVVITKVRQVKTNVMRRDVATDIVEVELEDGRTLLANVRVGTIEMGPRRIRLLRSTKTILAM